MSFISFLSQNTEQLLDPEQAALPVLAAWQKKISVLPKTPRAAWWGKNHPAVVGLRQLCAQHGINLIPLPAGAPPETVGQMMRDAGITLLAADNEHFDLTRQHADIFGDCTTANWEAAATDNVPILWPRKQLDERILFTSGTTGQPRPIVRSALNDLFRIEQIIRQFDLVPEYRHLVAGPLYHSGPAIFLMVHRHLGSPIRMLPKFDAQQVADEILSHKVDTLFLVPTQWHKLVQLTGNTKLPLKRAWIAGSAARPALLEQLRRILPANALFEFYGSTETGTVSVINSAEMMLHRGSTGRPVEEVRLTVVDKNLRPVPENTEGKIYVKSPMVMAGYLHGEKEDRLPDGSLSVGDRGYLDKDGYLYLAGREGDMMISGGVNVYPAEIENVALAHPLIDDALAFSLSDKLWGERIELAISIKAGNNLRPETVLDYLKDHLTAAAVPKKIHLMDQIPGTPAGKPDRRQTRARLYGNL